MRRSAAHIAAEFAECPLVDLTLELDHGIERNPVVIPAPGVKFGALGSPQMDIAVAREQTQQVPDLLLSAIIAAPIALDPLIRDVVAQPPACAPENLDVPGLQPDLFEELAIHR